MAREPAQRTAEPAHDNTAYDDIRTATICLEARINADRRDIQAWKDLIAHQATVVASSFAGSSKLKARQAISAVQMGMYKDALHSNPDSRELVLGYLDACAETMDDDAMLGEWDKAVDITADPYVVLRHVRFCQSLAARFSVPWMAGVYAASARRIQRCRVRSGGKASEIGTAVAELIHSACLFFREAGFAEHALALYQAALEWYVMTPPERLSAPVSHRMHAFRGFWVDMAPEDPSVSSIEAWCRIEMDRSKAAALLCAADIAALSDEQVQAMDPFALVVFEDVEPYLADLPPSLETAHALINGFLQFVGVVSPQTFVFRRGPGAWRSAVSELSWTVCGTGDDAFSPAGELFSWSGSMSGDPRSTHSHSANAFPLVAVPITLDTLDTPLNYAHVCPWLRLSDTERRQIAHNALLLLQQSRQLDRPSCVQLGVVLLEWAFVHSADSGAAVGKQLLAQSPTCLALWNALAKMHVRQGAWHDARRVWANAISLAHTMPPAERPWKAVLCKSWAVLETTLGGGLSAAVKLLACVAAHDADALQRLARMPPAPDNAVHPTDLECAQRLADDFTTMRCSENHDELHLATLTLRLWLAYAARRDPQAAEAEYRKHMQTPALELYELAICSIHLFHAQTSSVYRISDLRARLQSALRAFPHSTALWEMLLVCERRVMVASRVDRQLMTVLLAHPADALPDVRMLGVFVALRKNSQAGDANHVRHALRRATRDGSSVSLLAWLVYISFECELGAYRRAKRVLLAALRRCPWAKPLYMLALGGPLAGEFAEQESRALLRAMVRASIRTRTSLANIG
ncbi:hypothetical protein GGF43_002062 [Coemansia sp. RSA 2618]|nr:hypothetical protein GGF43_002062 [Coemansia sp. RSA 2618]